MVIKKLFIFLYFSSLFLSYAQCRTVERIDIEAAGIQYEGLNANDEKEGCQEFRPSEKQLIHFFKVARESEESGSLLHEYYSPCISYGTLLFDDGSFGEWTIQSSGLAYVTLKNGKTWVFFHKDNPWNDPFACTYGLDDEPEC
ncbi:hypothetical protein [Erwinia sp. 9145]|uniref:hypothetical protein n=1 Tax=Erwinia sp. 9145 TaxID=1500895 RepID=UPI00055012AC|nr:hypothetical protein [Erwinia sp. 9145]